MKISKKNIRFFLFVPFLALFLFTQCKDSTPPYQNEITDHFGGLAYLQVNFPGKVSFDSKEKLFTAKGIVKHKSDTIPSISWFMVANADGALGDLYVGSTKIATTGVVEMSVGDYISGSKTCWGASDGTAATQGALKNCLDNLNLMALMECVLASDGTAGFSCAVDCWMNNSQCF